MKDEIITKVDGCKRNFLWIDGSTFSLLDFQQLSDNEIHQGVLSTGELVNDLQGEALGFIRYEGSLSLLWTKGISEEKEMFKCSYPLESYWHGLGSRMHMWDAMDIDNIKIRYACDKNIKEEELREVKRSIANHSFFTSTSKLERLREDFSALASSIETLTVDFEKELAESEEKRAKTEKAEEEHSIRIAKYHETLKTYNADISKLPTFHLA